MQQESAKDRAKSSPIPGGERRVKGHAGGDSRGTSRGLDLKIQAGNRKSSARIAGKSTGTGENSRCPLYCNAAPDRTSALRVDPDQRTCGKYKETRTDGAVAKDQTDVSPCCTTWLYTFSIQCIWPGASVLALRHRKIHRNLARDRRQCRHGAQDSLWCGSTAHWEQEFLWGFKAAVYGRIQTPFRSQRSDTQASF
ncbi:hypothetical protein DPEC_G00122500 [Dallia pectoralis]|uniref:Uncharacterized protein n=1 Tax=Dallia pectoralis TaxID=75939 RepID=A0ACC2GQQ3_DALPE|nr:hypothetical protein DPEC_G00122500 [Dallia pectoralis]